MNEEFDTRVPERLKLIIDLEKYSHQEQHAVSNWLCAIRDIGDEASPDSTEQIDALERMLQAFITRKKLGNPVTAKGIEREFLGKWRK